MVPAANVAGTAAAAITTHRQCGERLRALRRRTLGHACSPFCSGPRRRCHAVGAVGGNGISTTQVGRARKPRAGLARGSGRPRGATVSACHRGRQRSRKRLVRSPTRWRAQRAERQARRHLDRADFDALRDAGLLTMPVPVEAGGLWSGVAASARPLCETYRSLAGGDASVALVSSMHPAVIAFWLASPDPSQPEWERQRSAVFASALAGEQWGTITSEPGSGGDLFKTRATAGSARRRIVPSGPRVRRDGRQALRQRHGRHRPDDHDRGRRRRRRTDDLRARRPRPAVGRLGRPAADRRMGRQRHGGDAEPRDAAGGHPLGADGLGRQDRGDHTRGGTARRHVVHVRRARRARRGGRRGARSDPRIAPPSCARSSRSSGRAPSRTTGWQCRRTKARCERSSRATPPSRCAPPCAPRSRSPTSPSRPSLRLTRVLGGGTFSRRSPFAHWFEDVRALGIPATTVGSRVRPAVHDVAGVAAGRSPDAARDLHRPHLDAARRASARGGRDRRSPCGPPRTRPGWST